MNITNKLKFCLTIIISATLYGQAALGKQDADNSWAMYQGNPSHTGFIPLKFYPESFQSGWRLELVKTFDYDASRIDFPIVANNSVAVSIEDSLIPGGSVLFVVDAKTGKIKWQKIFTTNNNFNDFNAIHIYGPAYENNTFYMQSVDLSKSPFDGKVMALDADSGEEKFAAPAYIALDGHFAPVPYAGNIYCAGGPYGGVYSFSNLGGSLNWFNNMSSKMPLEWWTPAVSGKYVAAYSDRHGASYVALCLLDRLSGNTVFKVDVPNSNEFDLAGELANAPILDEPNNLAITLLTGYLSAIDLSTGAVKYNIGPGFTKTGQPVLAYNKIIYAIKNNNLTAFDELSGNQLWYWQPQDGIKLDGNYLIATENIIFVSSDKATFAIDLDTHKLVWQTPITGPMAIDKNALYIVQKNAEGKVILYQFIQAKS